MGKRVSFAEVTLIEMKGLFVLEIPSLDDKCSFCQKSNSHGHEFKTKIQFNPKVSKHFVSFVPPVSACLSNTKRVPVVVDNETEAIDILQKHLTRGQSSLCLKVIPAGDDGLHARELQVGIPCDRVDHEACVQCGKDSSLNELCQHLKEDHLVDVKVVTSEDKTEEIKVQNSKLRKNCVILSDTEFQCKVCLQRFRSSREFKKHFPMHTKEKERKYSCNLCTKSFQKIQHLDAHVKIHFGIKSFSCLGCEKSFTSGHSLKLHEINVHGQGERPRCELCEKSFYSQSILKKHQLQKHNQDLRLFCPHCNQFYLRKDNLDKHMRECHNSDEDTAFELNCIFCKKDFKSRDSLRIHQEKSHGLLPWNQNMDLDGSERSENNQLKCKICEHFFSPSEMETHLRFSHGVMPVNMSVGEFSVSEAAEALLRTLTPQPDYLLRGLTPLPLERLDDFFAQ